MDYDYPDLLARLRRKREGQHVFWMYLDASENTLFGQGRQSLSNREPALMICEVETTVRQRLHKAAFPFLRVGFEI